MVCSCCREMLKILYIYIYILESHSLYKVNIAIEVGKEKHYLNQDVFQGNKQ